MKKLSILLLVFFCLFLNSLFLNAEGRIALVIGNSNYDISIGKLDNPKNDATDVTNALQNLGFKVILITDGNITSMRDGMNSFRDSITKDCEIALFFYAGHGVQDDKNKNYLIPIEQTFASEDDLEFYAINMDKILERMGKAKNKVLILDACRDNPLPKKTRSGSRGLAATQPDAKNTMIIYATSPGKIAQDGAGRNSPFTESLLNHINKNDIIEVVFKNVATDVEIKTKGEQEPWMLSSIKGNISLSGTLKVGSNDEKIETPNKIENINNTQTNGAVKTETSKVNSEIIRKAENNLNNNEKSTAAGYYIDSNDEYLYFLFNPEDYSFKFNEIKNKSITIACNLNNWNPKDNKWKLNRDDSLGMWKLIIKKSSIPNGMQFNFVVGGAWQQPNKDKVLKQNLKEDGYGGSNLIIRY